MFEPSGLGRTVFEKRYALHDAETYAEAADRVANHVGQADREHVAAFRAMIAEGLFAPGGRIMYGSGRPKGQLLNCFVAPTADSREGWGKTVSDMIQICGTGGGLGINCSPVRPRGAPIAGSGGQATGPVSLMEIINAAGEVIKAGGGRRTALMLCLDLDHPDLPEFLDAKLDLGRLNNANVSVVFNVDPEAFFEAVQADEEFPLKFRGRTVKTVKARALWEKIVKNALTSGEPGILNGWLANRQSNVHYWKPLISTNPCVPGHTEILTDDGYKRIDSLVGQTVNVWNGFEWSEVTPRVTGHDRRMVRVSLSNGKELTTTDNHHYWLAVGYQGSKRRVEAKDLKPGDKLIKHDYPVIEHGENFPDAYAQGFIAGDGMDGHKGLTLYRPKFMCFARLNATCTQEITNQDRVSIRFRFEPKPKTFVPFGWNLRSRLDWFAGLLDSDGTELKEGGAQVTSVNRGFLLQVQKMLTTMGVDSKVTKAADAGLRSMPDGNGGQKDYYCQETYRLLLGSTQIQSLKRLGMRCERLAFDKSPQRDASQFVQVLSVEDAGTESTVYCFTEPKRNLGCFDGVVTGQCGEIWLTEYDCCCLGALVLPRFVKGKDLDWALLERTVRTAVRFLDDVLTVNNYPLPEIRLTCENIRRIGLGIMGLHDMLLELGYRYNDAAGLEFVDRVMKRIKHWAYDASCELAKEKGAFPAFDAEAFLSSGFCKTLKPSLRAKIREHGIRNCAILTIAPTGTTSMVQGVSSGIEPMFAAAYLRRYRDGDKLAEETVIHPLFARFVREGKDVQHFQGAHNLSLRDHFEMQRTCQRHLDNACSKTINVPQGTKPEELSALYMEFLPELKGVTVYPEGSRENQPLTPLSLDEAFSAAASSLTEGTAETVCKSGACDI